MIAKKENGMLKIKAVFNLNNEGIYVIEEDNFILNYNSLIVELEAMEILDERVISLELIALGYPNINAYKKYIITEKNLSISDGKVTFEKINDMYKHDKKDINVISTLAIDTITSYDSGFFC